MFKKITSLLAVASAFILAISCNNNGKNTMASQIADAYGINKMDSVKMVAFTWNISTGNDSNAIHRHWEWNRDNQQVTYSGKDTTIQYTTGAPKDSFQKKIDKEFINDQYWLLFPFHLVWDNNVNLTEVSDTAFPMNNQKGKCLIVSYQKVGYTPNDKYELFVGDSDLIHQWVYMPGGDSTKVHMMSWEGYQDFNGIKVATEHYGKNNFHLWLSDISFQ